MSHCTTKQATEASQGNPRQWLTSKWTCMPASPVSSMFQLSLSPHTDHNWVTSASPQQLQRHWDTDHPDTMNPGVKPPWSHSDLAAKESIRGIQSQNRLVASLAPSRPPKSKISERSVPSGLSCSLSLGCLTRALMSRSYIRLFALDGPAGTPEVEPLFLN